MVHCGFRQSLSILATACISVYFLESVEGVYSIQVYSIQVYSIQVYSIQVYSIQVYSIQVYSIVVVK